MVGNEIESQGRQIRRFSASCLMKGVRISDEDRERALQMYMMGYSYSEIEAATGVSRASMSGIVKDQTRKDPNLAAIREVARYCREHEIPSEALLRGVAIIDRVEEAGSSLEEVTKIVIPFIAKAGDDAEEYCKNGAAYADLVESTGLTRTELVEEHQRLAQNLTSLSKKTEIAEPKFASLQKQIGSLESRLAHLRDLEVVEASLRGSGKGPGEAAKVVTKMEGLLKKGLSDHVMEALASELEKRGSDPANAPRVIAELVAKHGSLESAVEKERRKWDSLKRQTEGLDGEVTHLTGERATLKRQVDGLGTSLNELRSGYNSMAKDYKERESEFARKLAALDHEAKQRAEEVKAAKNQLAALTWDVDLAVAKLHVTQREQRGLEEAIPQLQSTKRAAEKELGVIRYGLNQAKQKLEGLQNECSQLREGIGTLKEEDRVLSQAKVELEESIGKTVEVLDGIDKKIAEKKKLEVLVTLVNEPENKMSPVTVMEPALIVLVALAVHMNQHASEISEYQALVRAARMLIELMTNAVRASSR